MRLKVSLGIARAKTHEVRVVGQVARVRNVVDLHKDAVAVVIDQIRQRISEMKQIGRVDLVTPNNWLSRLLGGLLPPPTERIGKALEYLKAKLVERGLVLRPHFMRESLAARGRGDPAFDMMMAAVMAARISATGTHFLETMEREGGSTELLLSKVEEAASGVRLSYFTGRQGHVVKELFRNAPGEDEAKARFKALAMDTHAMYVGRRIALHPFLPGPFDGGIGMLDESGVRALQKSYTLDPEIERRWVEWWREYAEILSRHPVLALREALLRLDGVMRTAEWPRIKHEMAVAWSLGMKENCPFKLRGTTEAHLMNLVRDCGGWPFPPPPETVPYGNVRKIIAA